MPGGSRSQLASCDNGLNYIVKCPHNSQGPNILANEFVATILLSSLNLPTPKWRIAKYSTGFGHPFSRDDRESFRHESCDLHFASELQIPSAGGRLYAFLPRSFVPRIKNRLDFLGALIFDIWAGSTDSRQAVYVEDHSTKLFNAVFIDNGHLFGGPHWSFSLKTGASLCLDHNVYANLLNPDWIELWVSRIEMTLPPLIPGLLESIPKQWYKGDIGRLQDTLSLRAECLRDLVGEEFANLKAPRYDALRGINGFPVDFTILPSRSGGPWRSAAIAQI